MTAAAYAEVVGSPYTAYVGPVATPVPALDATAVAIAAAGWFLLGTNGINNQGTAGVTVNLGKTTSEYTPAGGTLPVKAWTTDEKITVAGSLVDVSVEQFAMILDNATITTVAAASGNPGHKSINLVRGVNEYYYALLIRGVSPYDDGSNSLNAQYAFTRVYQSGSQQPKYLKGTPAELAWEFTVCGAVLGGTAATYDAETGPHT